MIVSASYRTDIPAYYGAWFLRRLEAGEALVANPYGGRDTRVSLRRADVDGFVFWTRNLAPFGPAVDTLAGRGDPFYVQWTITAYPRALETGTLAAATAIDQIHDLARRFGPRAAVWRYDPIVVTSVTPPDWHRENFARLAAALRGACDDAVVSFVSRYRKTARNLDAAARRHGFSWRDPPLAEKTELIADLASAAAARGMKLTLCTQPELVAVPAPATAEAARCIDAARLADIAQRPIAARTKGNRPGCLCAESRDIGAYNSCAQGCAYCYAVSSRPRAQAALQRHTPDQARLGNTGSIAGPS